MRHSSRQGSTSAPRSALPRRRGIEKGRREGEKHILVNLLTLRFGAGADWKAMLAPIEAEVTLQELTAVIATSDDLEVVKAAIAEATRPEPR